MRGEGEERVSLKRELGWFGAFSMGYADVGADIYVSLGLVALYTAGSSPIAFLLAALLYIATGLSYAELSSTYPYAGGVQVFSMRAFGDLSGFVSGWMMLLAYTVDITLFAMASAGYLSHFFPVIAGSTRLGPFEVSNLVLTTLVMISFLIFINVIGIKESAIFNELMIIPSIIVQLAIMLLGYLLVFDVDLLASQIFEFGSYQVYHEVSYIPLLDISTQNFLYGVTLATSSYIGIASIAQAAEETKRPYKWIPIAAKLSVVTVLFFTLGLSFLSVGMMPWYELAADLEMPLVSMASRIPVVGFYLAYLVGFTGFMVNLASANTGVVGVSRIVFSMSKYRQMPRWFDQIHPRFRTPTRAIMFFGAIGLLLTFLGSLERVADLYTFAALITYIFVNLAVIRLRRIDRDAHRPWESPSVLGIPLTGLVGSFMVLLILVLMILFHPIGRTLGGLWIALGLALYFLYRRAIGLPAIGKVHFDKVRPASYRMDVMVVVPPGMRRESVVEAIKRGLDRRYRLLLVGTIRPRNLEEARRLEDFVRESLDGIAEDLRRRGYEVRTLVLTGGEGQLLMEADAHDFVAVFGAGRLKGRAMGLSREALKELRGRLIFLG